MKQVYYVVNSFYLSFGNKYHVLMRIALAKWFECQACSWEPVCLTLQLFPWARSFMTIAFTSDHLSCNASNWYFQINSSKWCRQPKTVMSSAAAAQVYAKRCTPMHSASQVCFLAVQDKDTNKMFNFTRYFLQMWGNSVLRSIVMTQVLLNNEWWQIGNSFHWIGLWNTQSLLIWPNILQNSSAA